MTSARATRRRRERERRDNPVPVIPGVIPDLSDESKASAMREAHRQLPPVKRSTVSIIFLPPDEGLELISAHFGAGAAASVRARLEEVGGDDPHIVIGTRLPRHMKKDLNT